MIDPDSFSIWQNFLVERTGVFIPAEKSYLFENRLKPLLRTYDCENYQALFHKAHDEVDETSEHLVSAIIEAMTTHETSFFRDPWAFSLLEDLAHQAIAERKKTFRIWSAACSTGEEPYSAAMVLARVCSGRVAPKPYIMASDIAESTLEKAKVGRYRRLSDKIARTDVERFFHNDGQHWQVCDQIRDMVEYRHFNLMDVEKLNQTFDVIFCRNVSIYFTLDIRRWFFNQLIRILDPGGTLIIGASESLLGITNCFQRCLYDNHFYYKRA